jgi:hypothetical protein
MVSPPHLPVVRDERDASDVWRLGFVFDATAGETQSIGSAWACACLFGSGHTRGHYREKRDGTMGTYEATNGSSANESNVADLHVPRRARHVPDERELRMSLEKRALMSEDAEALGERLTKLLALGMYTAPEDGQALSFDRAIMQVACAQLKAVTLALIDEGDEGDEGAISLRVHA